MLVAVLVAVGTVGLSGLALQHGWRVLLSRPYDSTSAATLMAQRGHNAVMCAVLLSGSVGATGIVSGTTIAMHSG